MRSGLQKLFSSLWFSIPVTSQFFQGVLLKFTLTQMRKHTASFPGDLHECYSFSHRRHLDLYSDRNNGDLAFVVEAKCYVAQTSSFLTSKEGQMFTLLLISVTRNACWGRVYAWLFPCVINQCWCSIETDEKCAITAP